MFDFRLSIEELTRADRFAAVQTKISHMIPTQFFPQKVTLLVNGRRLVSRCFFKYFL